MYASVFIYFQDGQKQLLHKYLSVNVGKDLIPMFEMPCPLRRSGHFTGCCKQFVKLYNASGCLHYPHHPDPAGTVKIWKLHLEKKLAIIYVKNGPAHSMNMQLIAYKRLSFSSYEILICRPLGLPRTSDRL